MKNNFQSKSVPRGTRTIWRYLGALFLLFTFAIGNVWAADPTHASPSIVKVANRHFLNLGSTPSNVTVSTDSYSNYGPGYFISNKSADLSESWWSFTGTFKSNGSTYSNVSGAVGFHAVGSSSSSEFYQILQLREGSGRMTQMDFYVTGTTQIGFQWKNANTSGAKYLEFAIYEMNVSGTTATDGASPVSTIQGSTTSDADQYAASAALDGAKYYHVVVTPHNTSNLNFYGLTFKHAPAASYTITYDKNGGEGTMENSTNTISACTFKAPTGKEFKEWNTLATGLGDSYDPGDAASSDLDLFAIWQTKVEKFTVKYMDGTTELGSETVEVGEHPTGSEIADPTKVCYTFAGWSPALNTVTGTDGQVVNVNATWTPVYASGIYNFEGKSVTTSTTAASVVDGALYFSAISATLDTGDPLYYGWKLKTLGATVKFLVQNNSAVKVTLKEKSPLNVTYTPLEGTETTEAAAKSATKTVNVKGGTIVTLTTTTDATTTLNKIEVLPLYTATYTTSKSSVDPTSASNVTEVTLPTPSETTVGGYSFTGWIASQTVYKGETAKTAGEGLDAGETYTLTDNTAFTAQWQLISDFDVKFFQGYGDPDVQIGATQVISTGEYATAPTDPERAGFAFLGWSYDATEAHIVDVASYAITAATNFTAIWKQVFVVTFDGAGAVNVEDGETVASPNSPVMAGKVFQGWYNGESKYDFSAAVTGNLALESKWAAADPNHFVYAYNDDFHFDGVVYKTPEGAVDGGSGTSNITMTTPYTLFAGAEGITSIVMTDGIYDSKTGAIQAVTALMKVNNNATSKLTVTIKSGYTATLKIKSSGYSATRTINVSDATPASGTTTGQAVTSGAMSVSGIGELSFALNSGSHDLTVTGGTLYIAELDIEATALPTHTVTYKAGEGTGDDVEDADATEVRDGSTMFTAPTGQVFNGWKDALDNDVAVGAIVEADMTLTAQWIAHYAVTFNMQGHGTQIVAQDIVHGSKAVKPADPIAIGWDFGGWFTDAECTAGKEFDFNTPITVATPLFAKWTAFDGCVELWPATSGETLIVGATVDLQTGSTGGSIKVANLGDEGSIAYNANGLSFSNGGKDSVLVTLNNDLKNGSIIRVRLMANGGTKDSGRGLNLYNAANAKKALLGWQADEEVATGDVDEFTYTVEEGDGFAGTNIFILQRQNSVFLQSIKVEECGDAIVYHNLTSAVNIAGKGTVTLGANTVREGHTTTATYSDIDPLYEFVSWSVSGAGASIADASANPATITVGTEDAVVTLNLRLIPVKFTVEYYDGATLMGSEQVAVNENPTASEIVTAKRHYTFLGWSETDGGNVVALNTITRTEAGTVKLYAKYEAVACPVSGTIFSMEFDDTKTPGETVTIAKDASIDLAEYATISGGKAMIINGETSGKDAISTDGEFLLKATKEVMKIELNCVLQEGDIIRIPDNSAKLVISTSNAKTGTYQAFADKNTHEFAVTAAWAGVDDIYVLYDGSSLKFTKVYVIRPAKYTVSFDMKGHGSAIADIENVLEGSKITAPTAPTDENFSFSAWYKETTLENVWNFAEDVVTANTTLFAKWIDKSDATLKSLKYGSFDIALENDVYEYNIGLPSATVAVPALTAETNNPLATAAISDATEFDGEGKATSTVEVTPEKEGAAHQTYTVHFTILPSLPQVTVAASTLWDFSLAGNTALQNQTDVVLANMPGINNDENFNAQALEGSFNKLQGDGHSYQGSKLMFTVAEEGLLTIEFSGTNNHARHLQVCTGDGEIVIADWDYNSSSTHQTKSIEIPAGKITLKAFEGESANNARIYKMEYLSLAHQRTTGYAAGDLGTVCLEDATIIDGATLYELQGLDEHGYLAFDEILSGELEAGKPYLFQVTNPSKISFYKPVGAAHSDDEIAHKGMIGTFSGTTLNQNVAENYYYFSGRHIWRVNDFTVGITIPAHRCYVDYDAVQAAGPAQAPAAGCRRVTMGVNGKDAAQGFENILGGDQPMKVMIDGTLYIIRGEKVFDATGRLVK